MPSISLAVSGQTSDAYEVGAGSRVTTTGSGYVEWTSGTLVDVRNGVATWQRWPGGTAGDYCDTLRRVVIRGVATGALTVTWDEGRNDPGPEGVYWQEQAQSGIRPEDFGAVGDGVTDDLAAIQAAENAASALGYPAELRFDSGVYIVSGSIVKKSNVHWAGNGLVKRINNSAPTGTNFALVNADGVDDWSITGLNFEGVSRDVAISASLTETGGRQNVGAAIRVRNCDRWAVKDCTIKKVSRGVLMEPPCASFEVSGNRITADCGKTVASILDGTFTNLSSYANTGGIVCDVEGGAELLDKNSDFRITGNYIEIPGLDQGISPMLLWYGNGRGVVSNNVIVGANSGIQVYRGSYADPGSVVDYSVDCVIANNLIYATWEQGIYVRSVSGVLVTGNVLVHVANSVGGQAGTSNGGIVTRANFTELVDFDGSKLPPVQIVDNYILNPGRQNVVFDGAIQVRTSHCIVRGNSIVRDETKFTASLGNAITMGNGEKILRADIENNTIYNFAYGVYHAAGGYQAHAPGDVRINIEGNRIELITTTGILADAYTTHSVRIARNTVKACATGISIKRAPYAQIVGNEIVDCTTGVNLASENLASSFVQLRSANTYTTDAVSSAGGRIGGSVVVMDNSITLCTTSHAVNETATGDVTFHGRCAVWRGDMVNGRTVRPDEFSGATATTNSPRTWHKGEIAYNSTVGAATLYAKVCSVGGSYSANSVTISATGDTTSGSAVLTALSAMRGIGPGMYLTVGGNTKMVVDMDPDADTITFDSTFGATASGVAVSLAAPTFVDLVTAGAT